MPQFALLKNSAQHRVAAIALYRALLSRCSSAPLPVDDRTSLHNAIRNKFRRNRKIQSIYQLGHVFRAGYEVLHHLDASKTGNTDSLKSLTSLVATLPQRLKRSPPLPPPPPPPPKPSRTQFDFLPPEKAILNVRPYAKTSGPRHVPILATANGIPFLRIKKPQPPALSRVLRQKLQKRIDVFDSHIVFANYWTPLGRQEDEWDHLLEEQFGLEKEGEEKWENEISTALRQGLRTYQKMLAEDRDIADRMTKIVDEETRLAEQEGQKVVRGRKGKPIKSRWLK